MTKAAVMAGALWAALLMPEHAHAKDISSPRRIAQPSSVEVAVGPVNEVADGVARYEKGDFLGAMKELAIPATNGNSDAEAVVGIMYWGGLGVARDLDEGLRLCRLAASQGSFRAMNVLGYSYQYGIGLTADIAAAVEWYKKSAQGNDRRALNNLAILYFQGAGVAKDINEARHLWVKSANLGDGGAMMNLARSYWEEGSEASMSEAISWLKRAALANDTSAMVALGAMSISAQHMPLDVAAGVDWYRKAATLGNSDAFNELGVLYFNGTIVTKDIDKARSFWDEGARRGNPYSMNGLAMLDYFGIGGPQSKSKAVAWWRESAARGNADAANVVGRAYLLGDGVPQDSGEAEIFFKIAAQGGSTAAMFSLGDIELAHGNADVGHQWIRRSAEKGNVAAQARLGQMLLLAMGLPRDDVEGIKWLKLAAEQQNGQAMQTLGFAYGRGIAGQPPDLSESFKWTKLGAEKSIVEAEFNLGEDYLLGRGTSQDFGEASRWLEAAAKGGLPVAMNDLATLLLRRGTTNNSDAYRWYEKAAGFGMPNAMFSLAGIYLKGTPEISPDPIEASYWANLAIRFFKPDDPHIPGLKVVIKAADANLSAEDLKRVQARITAFVPQTPFITPPPDTAFPGDATPSMRRPFDVGSPTSSI